MTITYDIEQTDIEDESKQITVVETKEVTSTKKLSVADLKREHSYILQNIESLKSQADKLVDEIQAINDDEGIDLIVKDIPTKLSIIEAVPSK